MSWGALAANPRPAADGNTHITNPPPAPPHQPRPDLPRPVPQPQNLAHRRRRPFPQTLPEVLYRPKPFGLKESAGAVPK